MKRKRDERKEEDGTTLVEYRGYENWLTLLPSELFIHIMSYLSIEDLKSFCTYIKCYQPSITIIAAKFLECVETERLDIKNLHGKIVRNMLNTIHYETSECRETNEASALEKIKTIVNNPSRCVDVLVFNSLCSCCRSSFSCKVLWKSTGRPLHICRECDRKMRKTLNEKEISIEAHKDGWAWVGATQMKIICGIPKNQKAEDYALERRIRTHASSTLTFMGVVGVKSSNTKQHYFLLDVLPFIKFVKKEEKESEEKK